MIEYENLKLVNQPYEVKFKKALTSFLESGYYILGNQVRLFEEEFAKYCGSKFCIGVANGLDALYLSLIALELPKGAEVIVPSNTYIATILSIINAGLKPVLVEPKLETYNIDPNLIPKYITKNTKAIMVVHLYGKPCEMEKIVAIGEKFHLAIVEDCAQAHGAKVNGKMVGNWGVFGAYSFYPTKNLGALGDAGAIITDNEDFANKLKALRNYGSHKKYHNYYIGINSRLDELQALFLRIKLQDLNQANQHKKNLANIYFNELQDVNIILPIKQEGIKDVHHIFNIRTNQRDELQQYLFTHGVKTEIHYPIPAHQQVGYQTHFINQSFPISELIHNTTLSLPISNSLSTKEISKICTIIKQFFTNYKTQC
ncbi:aminotransferase [Pedobacter sp. LMG 31464]|uniref:Aminotransferase n=1 Tax=Pedobacter planticolens TaxID=2679964 RepID=A0A923ITT5_9SPHI|nr:DegT/DnrJ/EryC1/StrS family aminotransferase [Pedobacter planticolens]MBB2144106.1 aminotransferase [Pedobacter planticolens]